MGFAGFAGFGSSLELDFLLKKGEGLDSMVLMGLAKNSVRLSAFIACPPKVLDGCSLGMFCFLQLSLDFRAATSFLSWSIWFCCCADADAAACL